MGDDVGDIPLLLMVGMPACPQDAHHDVVNCVVGLRGFVATKDGGKGSVREFCDYIIEENRRESFPELIQEYSDLTKMLHD